MLKKISISFVTVVFTLAAMPKRGMRHIMERNLKIKFLRSIYQIGLIFLMREIIPFKLREKLFHRVQKRDVGLI